MGKRYNLFVNNSFETQLDGFASKWFLHEGNATTDNATTASPRTGSYGLAIQGILGTNRRVNQSIHVSGEEGDIFTLSGWAKLEAIPDTNVLVSAAILYDTGDPKWVHFDLNYYVSGWQYISGIISTDDNDSTTNRNYVRMDIYIFYDNNYNVAYFDDFQLNRDDEPTYVYDEDGNLKSVTSMEKENAFSYDSNNNLENLIDATGTSYTYTYGDSGWKDLLTAYNGQAITYDNIGNALTWRDGMTYYKLQYGYKNISKENACIFFMGMI